MARRDDDDHVHDDRPRKSDSTVLVVVLAVAGVLVVVCGGMAALAFFGWRAAVAPDVEPPVESSQSAIFLRGDFKSLVMGKTPEEVIKRVGKPDSTQDIGGEPTWYYRNRTIDPTTGAVDDKAQVEFKNGRAVGVNYD
jgi:hypothetical protein